MAVKNIAVLQLDKIVIFLVTCTDKEIKGGDCMSYYTLEGIENLYRQEFPGLTLDVIHERAKNVHRQLNTLDIYWRRSNQRFYRKIDLWEKV